MLQDIINKDVVSVKLGTKLPMVCKLMKQKNVGCVIVLNGDQLQGIVTDRDIVVRCIASGHDIEECEVDHVMTKSPATVNENDGIYDCIQKMKDTKARRMPVISQDGKKVIGLISFGDLIAILSKELSDLASNTTNYSEFEEEFEAA